MAKDLPINPRLIKELANATIKNLIDGIVELITNADDSYKRMENNKEHTTGEIEVYVNRKKGGICEKLIVRDYAEGMTQDTLKKAIEFASETSGYEKTKTVRGLFGRGLKETIVALGRGQITTVKDNKMCSTSLWSDKKTKRSLYDDEQLEDICDTKEKNGTEVNITIQNESIKIPEFDNFKDQLSKHQALRDINSSTNRNIKLTFVDVKRGNKKITTKINFSYPIGKKIFEKVITISKTGQKATLRIFQSDKQLDFIKNNPFSLAGILVKTDGAILDNQYNQSKFSNDPASHYFFGEIICHDLDKKIREGEIGIINPARGGLEWRHDFCQMLSNTIDRILEPYISEKRKDLEKKPDKAVKETTNKMLKKLCNLLNELAEEDLEGDFDPNPNITPDIEDLTIIPLIANVQIDRPRTLLVVAPTEIVEQEGKELKIYSDSTELYPLTSNAKLEKSTRYPEKIWSKYFKVVGVSENAVSTITVQLGSRSVTAKVKVAPPKEVGTRKPKGKQAFITDIKPDDDGEKCKNQRVFYESNTGIIWINLNFPSTNKFIKSGFEGIENDTGKLLVAELVGEAFCKQLARKRMEIDIQIPGSEIDSFNSTVNEIQKKYLHKIQELIFNWKF
jgi:hypothetical protein